MNAGQKQTEFEHRIVESSRIPALLCERPQWVLWREVVRDGRPTKMLFQLDGSAGRSNDPSTWSPYDKIITEYARGNWDGPGYVFSAADNFCGIDLDGCRDPETGRIAEWAQKIIDQFGTYAEVSPSETGVKMFCIGKNPLDCGKNKKLKHKQIVSEKKPGVEIYDKLRYFAVTGWKLEGKPGEPQECQKQIDEFCANFWPQKTVHDHRGNGHSSSHPRSSIIERARKYLTKMPGAISGQGGHSTAFHTACVLVQGFNLTADEAFPLYAEWNQGCDPPWSEYDMRHKLEDAVDQPGERGNLLDAHKGNGRANYYGGHNPETPISIHSPNGRTETANGRRFVQQNGNNVRYCHPWKKWIGWDGKRWKTDDTAAMERLAKRVADQMWQEAQKADNDTARRFAAKSASSAGIRAMLSLAASEPGIPILPDALDCDPWLLNVQNGTVDLRTG